MTRKHKLWHAAFRKWYDHKYAGHHRRAAVWGWVSDKILLFYPSRSQ